MLDIFELEGFGSSIQTEIRPVDFDRLDWSGLSPADSTLYRSLSLL